MKNFRNVSLLALTLLPLLSCVTSCEKERSGYNEAENGSLHCSVNKNRLWFWTETPEIIKLFLYPTSGSELKNAEIAINGGTVGNILENRYDIIALTGNLKNTNFRGMGNYHTAEIYLPEKIDKDGNSVIGQPEIVYADRGSVHISPERTTEKELQPVSLVKCLAFHIKSVGIAPIEKYSCCLTGVASAIRLHNAEPVNCRSSVIFEPEKVITDYFSRVLVFGFSTAKDRITLLNIDCFLSNGSKKSVTLDLTRYIDLFNSDSASCTIEIDFEHLDVALNPSVTITDWQTGTNGYIELN